MKPSARGTLLWLAAALLMIFTGQAAAADSKRQVVSLDGTWQIEKGGVAAPDSRALGTVPVPGLTDLAKDVNGTGDYWWYERTFDLSTTPTEVALLRIGKSMFGTQVYLNGHLIDEYLPSFSPSYHDVRPWLQFNGKNTLLVRVGERRNLPKGILDMGDFEKINYTPGIYDSVALILDNGPHIETVQTNPRLDGTLEIKAILRNTSAQPYQGTVHFTIATADDHQLAGQVEATVSLPPSGSGEVRATLKVQNCRLWTPEKPFLYVLTTETAGDQRDDRLGMRTFDFDPTTRRPLLNGKPYPLLGTNICIFRFFDDSLASRGALPWNKEWLRALLKKFKTMHWNSMRICIGPPPDFWYDLFDEEGFLVQDEMPIWYAGDRKDHLHGEKLPPEVTPQEIVAEVTPCIYDRCNHPSIYAWDLSNETTSQKTKQALAVLRPIDLQARRWENGTGGFNPPVNGTDLEELHLYPFEKAKSTLEVFNKPLARHQETNPLIVNEYGWLWLARDGSPCRISAKDYAFLLGGPVDATDYGTEAERRYLYATYMAADTEYLRASRQFAGVQQFCGLSYNRPLVPGQPIRTWGATSDNFLEPISALKFDPYFENYMKDAFAPVGLCIDRYDSVYPAGSTQTIPVSLYDDAPQDWQGEVRVMIVPGGPAISKRHAQALGPVVTKSCQVKSMGKITATFDVAIPRQTGDYSLIAEYGDGPDRVLCLRDFVVGKNPRWVK